MATLTILVDGTVPVAADFNNNFNALNTETRGVTVGGTGLAAYATGDLIYASAASTLSRRAVGAKYSVLSVNESTLPDWVSILTNHLAGLTLSNNVADATNDLDIAAGMAVSLDATFTDRTMMYLPSAITKRLDAAWVVGSGNGGLDTGSIADVTYHLWLIKRVDTGVVDVLFSASATAPVMPTNYTKKRRLGSIRRVAGVIKPFVQIGDEFRWVTAPAIDVDDATPGTAAVTRILFVPLGIRVWAFGRTISTTAHVYISSLDVTDEAPSATIAPLGVAGAFTTLGLPFGPVLTDTAGQVRSRSTTNTLLRMATAGFIDRRGRDD